MAEAHRVGRRRWLRFPALAAIVLALFFLHVWTQVDPRLIVHRQGPVFLTGRDFLRPHLEEAGGLAEYASAFLSQFHALGWPGAAVLTALAAGIAVATWGLLRRLGRQADVLALAPVVCLAMLANQYDHPMVTAIGLLVALAAANVYAWLAPERPWARAALFTGLAAAVYYAAAGAMLLLGLLAAVQELLATDRPKPAGKAPLLGLAYLALAAAMPYAAARWVFVMGRADAYARHLPFLLRQDVVSLAASVGLYGVIAMGAAWAALWPTPDDDAGPASRWSGARAVAWLRRTGVGWAATSAALVAAGVVLTLGSLDSQERALLALDYFASEGLWEDALAQAPLSRTLNTAKRSASSRALYHTGRLLESLFACPQGKEQPPPPTLQQFYDVTAYDRGSQALLDLGQVNEAEHMACEALETLGPLPRILKRLAIIHILKGQPEAARVYLGALEKTLWDAPWARQCRRELEADPHLASRPEVQRLRALMVSDDRTEMYDTETGLLALLRANPGNRMALEYLVANRLLSGRADRVVEDLGRFRQAGYPSLPRHVQEAVLHDAWVRRRTQVNLHGYALPPETTARYREFLRRLEPAMKARDPAAAWQALKGDFGDTYWFFFTFGCTPHWRAGPPPRTQEATP